METLFRKGIYRILRVFYHNDNSAVHLREIARRTDLNENSVSRFLNELVKSKVLVSKKEESVRKFHISQESFQIIFSLFDSERFNKLPFIRKMAIKDYLFLLKEKPFCLILFGSSSRGQDRNDSDLDLIEISSFKEDSDLLKKIEAERGVKLSLIRLNQKDFKKAILNKDSVILSAINSGFPVFGKDFFYEVIKNGQ